MVKRTTSGIVALVITGLAVWFAFVLVMRAKYPPVLTAIRRLNRSFVNPRSMETAGRPDAYASIIQHVGRTSGNRYQTPVQAWPTDDGFVISLPYGSTADWLQNVLAAGSADIVNEGKTYRVDQPELVSRATAEPHIPSRSNLTHRLYGVDDFLQLKCVDPE
jgi:deazaflavin-dependent oxidoreductase (nitroreductase family)